LYHIGCVIFCTRRKESQKYVKVRELSGWKNMTVWKDFRLSYISEAIWAVYIQQMTFTRFTRQSQTGAENHNQCIHGSVTTHTNDSVLIISHAKHMIDFFFHPFFY
jgi:hypothetical protein